MIGRFLQASWTFFERMFTRLFSFLGDLLGKLFQGLIDFIKLLFRPVFIVVAVLFYFVYKVAELAVTLFQLFLALGKVVFSLVTGLFTTLSGFTFTPAVRNDGEWTSIFNNVVGSLDDYQLDNIAYVLLFLVWFATGFAAIRILSTIRNGEG